MLYSTVRFHAPTNKLPCLACASRPMDLPSDCRTSRSARFLPLTSLEASCSDTVHHTRGSLPMSFSTLNAPKGIADHLWDCSLRPPPSRIEANWARPLTLCPSVANSSGCPHIRCMQAPGSRSRSRSRSRPRLTLLLRTSRSSRASSLNCDPTARTDASKTQAQYHSRQSQRQVNPHLPRPRPARIIAILHRYLDSRGHARGSPMDHSQTHGPVPRQLANSESCIVESCLVVPLYFGLQSREIPLQTRFGRDRLLDTVPQASQLHDPSRDRCTS